MIDVVSLYFLADTVLFVELMHVIKQLMSLSELVDHKFLKLDHIYNVKEGFYLVEDHDT
jgi:hypothetical protein